LKYRVLVREPEKKTFGRPRHRCEYNIKLINKENVCDGVE
jgi:hypothetical protein